MDTDYGVGEEIAEEIEDLIIKLCMLHGLTPKTPPHDMAAWIVKELKKAVRKGTGPATVDTLV